MSSVSHKLVVTNPCREGWDSMTATDGGRYCTSCEKTVIDFSMLSDADIQSFFINNGHRAVCGRFRGAQLNRIRISLPLRVLRKPVPYWKKFLVIFLICFGSNIYPFDVVINGHSNLYAQTEGKSPVKKKTRVKYYKKRKKQNRIIRYILPKEYSFEVLGFTQSFPSNEPTLLINLLNPSTNGKDSHSASLSPASLFQENDPIKEKKSPKPKPANNNEYILPAAFNHRRRRRNKNQS